ncbi:MAG: type II toxin-antitoxin system ParD family antitoxin [Cyanobacteria bacterium SBLK]|nr:type II toxin-antitoxin system ParD family antitoxin [Cyanobacteria bacterium SBLK]
MSIVLSPEQAEVLELLVKRGGYDSVEVAIDTALGLLADEVSLQDSAENPEYVAWVAETRQKIEDGLEQSKQGDYLDAEVVIDRLRDKVKAAREAEA